MNRQLRNPYFLFLLPLFFVLHVCAENPGLVPFRLAFAIFLEFTIIAVVISLLFQLLVKDFHKAALIGFFITAFDIFFGSIQDFLLSYFAKSFFAKYSVIIAITLAAIVLLTLYLKRSKKNFRQPVLFLNLLFTVLIIIDVAAIIAAATKNKTPAVASLKNRFVACDTCQKPDIYIILADGYPGNDVIKNYFGYDNAAFTDTLEKKGFHIVKNSLSNYNFTVYTLASMFNMDYIHGLNMEKNVTQQDIYLCRDLIEKSNFVDFLKMHDYDIQNFSFLNIGSKNNKIRMAYFPPKRALFTSQTFLNRFFKNTGFNFPSLGRIFYRNIKSAASNNRIMDSLTRQSLSEVNANPRFSFTHILLPHHPYYYDSLGNLVNAEGKLFNGIEEKQRMIQYLSYSNKKLLSLVDTILNGSKNPPVLMLLSDHGYRKFPEKTLDSLQFLTLNALYFPERNYSGFYDGISTVNQLRVFLTSRFAQNLPPLKDSTSFIIEP